MKRSKHQSSQKKKRIWIGIGFLTVMGIAILVCVLLTPGMGSPEPPLTDVTLPSMEETPLPVSDGSIDLGSGIVLKKLSFTCGNYPEDGSDDFLPDILAATFVNTGKQTLQYAKILVTVDGEPYHFEFSTLPPGKSVCAFEMDRATTPESVEKMTAQVEFMSFFQTEPHLMDEQLKITVENGYLSVQNISSEDLEGEVSVFFKNTMGSAYMGGITYRVRIGGIAAGQTVSGYSSHAFKDCSEIMFVQFTKSNG